MRGTRLATAILALASLGVFTATSQAQKSSAKAPPAAQNVSSQAQAGIAQLRIAKGYLEKAGDKWGGHRVSAVQSIDQAFKALGVSPESTSNEMQSGDVDEPGMMNSGISSLQAAKADFAKAGNGPNGRNVQAVSHINQALQDLQQGIAWAQQHKTY